ncbi:hypothetical protein XELAEV_18026284mg [Xenopus laevis]|uniref:Uncharacterized protein n=1 Tax=Xenopus laevis TaxID=8355 RepID=A0A974HIP7_XENLA|nr:hypothetical protein XELAEV_18026284mg [Xenopus laevis]
MTPCSSSSNLKATLCFYTKMFPFTGTLLINDPKLRLTEFLGFWKHTLSDYSFLWGLSSSGLVNGVVLCFHHITMSLMGRNKGAAPEQLVCSLHPIPIHCS